MVAQPGGNGQLGEGEESSAMPATALAEPERQQQAASMEAMLQAMMTQLKKLHLHHLLLLLKK